MVVVVVVTLALALTGTFPDQHVAGAVYEAQGHCQAVGQGKGTGRLDGPIIWISVPKCVRKMGWAAVWLALLLLSKLR